MTSTGRFKVQEKRRKDVPKMTQETTLTIPAIHCDSCVKTITQTLQALPTVVIANADPRTKLVRLEFDEAAVTVDQIREALDDVGFSPD